MTNKSLVGKWLHAVPENSDDYTVEYEIRQDGDSYSVRAIDLTDEEEMEITNVKWDGKVLSFDSHMPSTSRTGFHQFRLKENGNIEAKFTFTVLEEMKRSRGEQDY